MEDIDYSGENPKEKMAEDDDFNSGFMDGYGDDDEVEECSECGSAIKDKKVVRTIAGEKYLFCSEDCAKEFEETIGEN